MQTSVDQRGDVTTVHISGSVDALTSDDLQRVFSGELDAGRHELVADYGAVEYMSSAGLRVLLATVKQARARGGDLRLAGVQPEVLKVLQLSGFTGILRVFTTVDEAAASFDGRAP
jgi:anti-sigma B factor antagonist